MESKSKGEAAHLDASAKIGRGRGGDDGSGRTAPTLARRRLARRRRQRRRPREPRRETRNREAALGFGRRDAARGATRPGARGGADDDARRRAARPRESGARRRARGAAAAAEPDAGRHRDGGRREVRAGRSARADGSTLGGSDRARAVPVPAPDSRPGEDALPARRRRRRGSGAKQRQYDSRRSSSGLREGGGGVVASSRPWRRGRNYTPGRRMLGHRVRRSGSQRTQLSRGLRSVGRRRRGQDCSIRRSVWVRQEHDGAGRAAYAPTSR